MVRIWVASLHQKSSTHECALDFCFGRRFSYYEGAAPCIRPCASCLKIRRSLRKKKKARQSSTDQRAILVGAAGFEPTASSSRTRRATNCAMPRKYRSRLGCGLVGDERIELPQVESESTALPLCKSPIFCFVLLGEPLNVCYYTGKGGSCQALFQTFTKILGICNRYP